MEGIRRFSASSSWGRAPAGGWGQAAPWFASSSASYGSAASAVHRGQVFPISPPSPTRPSPASSRQPGCGLTRLWPPEVERDECVTSPQFCLGVLTLHSWNLGGCSVGRSALDRELLNWALGPSGTGLGNREAGLIFSQRSKYCPPYFSTGNPGMTWEPAFPEILCLGGGGPEEQGCLAFFLYWQSDIASWFLGDQESFPFKDIGAAELSLPFQFAHL